MQDSTEGLREEIYTLIKQACSKRQMLWTFYVEFRYLLTLNEVLSILYSIFC